MTSDHLKTNDQMLEALRQRFMQPKFAPASMLIQEDPVSDDIIKGLIGNRGTVALIGASGSGKTFVVLDIGLSILPKSRVISWNGHRIKKRGAVLYLAGEGRRNVIRRLKAYALQNNLTPDDLDQFYVSSSTLSLDSDSIEEIVQEVNSLGVEVVFIIVDTLARHLAGDENSTKDMSEFINQVDKLRDLLGATVIIVHHTGHGDQTRGRGSSSFRAALDVEMQVAGGKLSFSKVKDDLPPEPIHFKLEPVVIGYDEDGEPVTSCVVRWGERSLQSKLGDLTHSEQTLLQVIDSNPGELIGDIRQLFYAKRRESDPEAKHDTLKKTFSRALDGIILKGFKMLDGNYVVGGQGTKGDISGHCPPVDGGTVGGHLGTHSLECPLVPPPVPQTRIEVPPWQR